MNKTICLISAREPVACLVEVLAATTKAAAPRRAITKLKTITARGTFRRKSSKVTISSSVPSKIDG
jgi:hypothetical protein